MALSATTGKARLCHSTSSSKVTYSPAVGTQLSGRHELFSCRCIFPNLFTLCLGKCAQAEVVGGGGGRDSPFGFLQDLGLMSASDLGPTSLPNAVFATVAILSTKPAK